MTIREQISEERKRLQNEGLVPNWMTTDGWSLFKQKYAVEGELGFRGRAETIAKTLASHTDEPSHWEPKFFELIWNGWVSCSTPVLSNTGVDRGCSVSCSGGVTGDSIYDFYEGYKEAAILTKNGFGTSTYLGGVRARGEPISIGGNASGALPVFQDYIEMSRKVTQGNNRRGAIAIYYDLTGADFDELADYVKEYPDDANIGWNVYDRDVDAMDKGCEETRRRYKKALKLKLLTGKGYFFFPDKANRASPQMYKDKNLTVKSSNLCSEITLFADEDHTFTCVLASMNLAKYREWKDTEAVFTATVMLDCVASDFIKKGSKIKGLEKAVRFTEKGRALGLGVCGFHTYLQQEMIAFESLTALFENRTIFKSISEEAKRASAWMAQKWGEPEWCKGYGVRNTHLMAVAPTMSTSLIMGGISQGIEPMIGNAFVQSSAGGELERVNPVFLDLMKKRGKYTKKLVKHIADNNGSVQDQDWLTDEEKLVYRTAFEINQEVIIRLASQRQPYICQGQSLNIFFSSDEKEEYISKIHKLAFKDENIKALYYLRTQAGVEASSGECVACQ